MKQSQIEVIIAAMLGGLAMVASPIIIVKALRNIAAIDGLEKSLNESASIAAATVCQCQGCREMRARM